MRHHASKLDISAQERQTYSCTACTQCSAQRLMQYQCIVAFVTQSKHTWKDLCHEWHVRIWILACDQRERDIASCFNQSASLIIYRRRQRSNLEDIKTAWNKLENCMWSFVQKRTSWCRCPCKTIENTAAQVHWGLNTQKPGAFYLQQPHYHNVCKPYWS